MEENNKTMPIDDEKLAKYMRRIREEVKRNLDKKWEIKKYTTAAKWLLFQYVARGDSECAEEAATYILAATYMLRGDKS